MVKKAPTDEDLRETVKSLLKDADLEEMTMKQICQRVRITLKSDPENHNKTDMDPSTSPSLPSLPPCLSSYLQVFDRYPDHDLSSRKDYIKQTVKSVSAHTHTPFSVYFYPCDFIRHNTLPSSQPLPYIR